MIRYFRFAVNGATGYDAMRAAGDLTLSLSAPDTCIEPAATAPLDTKGRILLAVNTASIVYPAILPSLNSLISSTACEEISEADYWGSFEQVIATGGGGAQDASSVTVAGPFVALPTASNVEAALLDIDASIGQLVTEVSAIASYTEFGMVSVAQNTGLTIAGGMLEVTFGTSSVSVCRGSDSRLSNARTPTAHASTHRTGGSDFVGNLVVTPSSLTADVNDWSLQIGDVYRVSGTAARNITGIASGSSGQTILLINVGTFALTIKHASTSSISSNRFTVPWAGDCVLPASGGAAVIVYDSTSLTWRVL